MQLKRLRFLGCAVLSLLISTNFARAEELPPPPEAIDMPAIGSESGAELPPLPETIPEEQPTLSAEAPAQPAAAEDAPLPESVPIDEQSAASNDGLTEISPSQSLEPSTYSAPRPSLATKTNLMDLGVDERLKTQELVLWLTFGGSFGAITPKGTYASSSTSTTDTNKSGGMGYSAGIGWMLAGNLQMGLDFMGTPRTVTTTVDSGMVGIGPRLGFLYAMGMVGAISGEDLAHVGGGKTQAFGYGLKGGMDFVLGHASDSRVSYGIAPEAYYITSQAEDGYSNYGVTFNFRIYGYENAF